MLINGKMPMLVSVLIREGVSMYPNVLMWQVPSMCSSVLIKGGCDFRPEVQGPKVFGVRPSGIPN